ncbi:MAG: cytochrome C oxidase subunit IV family protein [Lewinellaceae bacterium]|nr:cytochrome C oxidase subunit IV family protein [Lewinellaceae bacterium]
MGHLSYEEAKKVVYKGLVLLAVVTLIEVFFSLLGKGHVIPALKGITWLHYLIGMLLIALSLYKAYFIIYEFMHMRYEVKGLAMSVLLPTLLLIWAIIAFFQEGNSWKNRRELIKEKNVEEVDEGASKQESMLLKDTYILRLEEEGI